MKSKRDVSSSQPLQTKTIDEQSAPERGVLHGFLFLPECNCADKIAFMESRPIQPEA